MQGHVFLIMTVKVLIVFIPCSCQVSIYWTSDPLVMTSRATIFQVTGLTLRLDEVDLALMYLATVQALAVSPEPKGMNRFHCSTQLRLKFILLNCWHFNICEQDKLLALVTESCITISCSTQLRLKFVLLKNVKMPVLLTL